MTEFLDIGFFLLQQDQFHSSKSQISPKTAMSSSRPTVKWADIVTVVLLVKVTLLFECINRLNLKVQDSNLIEQEIWEGLTGIGAEKEKLERRQGRRVYGFTS